ncbi:MAG: hypothetical protein ACK5N8_07075 [Alphaproteobacteria bacterium]
MKKLFYFLSIALCAVVLISCDSSSSKIQKAAENFGTGEKNFFDSYGLKTSGEYVAGRVVFAEDRKYDKGWGVYLELDNGKSLIIDSNEEYKCYPFTFVTEDEKKLHRGEQNVYDAVTVKSLYVEAIVNDGVSYFFVYYDYEAQKAATDFMKSGSKTKVGESSLNINDYKKSKIYGSPRSSGKASVVEAVLYRGAESYTSYYLSDGNVITITDAMQSVFSSSTRDYKKNIKKDDVISYVLSNMDGESIKDGSDIFTNTLDYVIE